MDKKANDTFAYDLENRLDDFFSDSLPAREKSPADSQQMPETDLRLKELKSTILAIDWEITDAGLEAFIYQVEGLMEQFEDDKVAHTLLKLLKSLGKYIRVHKSNAHPDTIKRIMAVYSVLEESVTDQGLAQDKKEKMVLEEVKQFRLLKAKIIATKSPYLAGGSQKPMESGGSANMDAFIKAIDELKSMMATELGAIREELGALRKK